MGEHQTKQPESVGLLFGSFNPPHLGHLDTARKAREKLSLKEVWLIPAGQTPEKKHIAQAAIDDKLAMCRLLAEPEKGWLKVSGGLKDAKTGYKGTLKESFRLASRLVTEHPEAGFCLIGGSDNGIKLRLFALNMKLAAFLTILKNNQNQSLSSIFKAAKTSWNSFYVEKVPSCKLRSTRIRQNLEQNKQPHGCPKPVQDYIKSRNLYGPGFEKT